MDEQAKSIKVVDKVSSGFDAREFDGQRVKIARVLAIMDKSNYIWNPELKKNEFNKDKFVLVPKIEVETEEVTKFTKKDGKEISVRVSSRVPIQQEVNKETGKKEIVISKASVAKLWQFMRKLGITEIGNIKYRYDEATKNFVLLDSEGKDIDFLQENHKESVVENSPAIGKLVTLTTVPSRDPDDDRVFLRIAM